MPTKPKPKPLRLTQAAIKKEQAMVVKRTQLRIAQLLAESNACTGQVNVATQTDHAFPPPTEISYRNLYLTVCSLCVLVLCMHLCFLQWLYLHVIEQQV